MQEVASEQPEQLSRSMPGEVPRTGLAGARHRSRVARAGLGLAGTVNTFSYLAWALWLIVVGVVLLVRRTDATPMVRPAMLAHQGGPA